MDHSIIHRLEEESLPESAGTMAALFVEDLVFAAEYWALRAAQICLSAARLARRPAIVICSLAVASGSAFAVNIYSQLHDEQAMSARLEMRTIVNGIELFQSETGKTPSRLEDLAPKYLKELRLDPWGRNYVLYRGAGGLAVVSAGPDGQLGTRDDIVNVISPNAPREESVSKCRTGYCDEKP